MPTRTHRSLAFAAISNFLFICIGRVPLQLPDKCQFILEVYILNFRLDSKRCYTVCSPAAPERAVSSPRRLWLRLDESSTHSDFSGHCAQDCAIALRTMSSKKRSGGSGNNAKPAVASTASDLYGAPKSNPRKDQAAREEAASRISIPTASASAAAAARVAVPQSHSVPSTSDSALDAESDNADEQDVEVTNDAASEASGESAAKRPKIPAAAINQLQQRVIDGFLQLAQTIPEAAPVLSAQVARSQSVSASSSYAAKSASASILHAAPAPAAASSSSSSSSSAAPASASIPHAAASSSSSSAAKSASASSQHAAPAPAAASSSSSSSSSAAPASASSLHAAASSLSSSSSSSAAKSASASSQHAAPAPAAASSSSSSSSASNPQQSALQGPASAAANSFLSPARQAQDWKHVLDLNADCWQLFQKHKDGKSTKCKACDNVYSFSGGNTKSMIDHIGTCKQKASRTSFLFAHFVSFHDCSIGLTRQKSILLSNVNRPKINPGFFGAAQRLDQTTLVDMGSGFCAGCCQCCVCNLGISSRKASAHQQSCAGHRHD
jgi:hypothetical protein